VTSYSPFERTSTHDRPAGHVPRESERVRLAATTALVPPDVGSVLEVGCGPGDLINALPVSFAVGTDPARRGLKHVTVPVVQSTIQQLPFADAAFDLVLCAEVLEHLAPEDLAPAAAELVRVARRYVLVSVPHQEQLLADSHRCARCRTVFHLHGHRHSLGPADLCGLFPGQRVLETKLVWPIRPYCLPLLRLRTYGLGMWKYSSHSLCPRCGNQALENHEERLLYRLCGAVNRLLRPSLSARRWLIMLFEVDRPADCGQPRCAEEGMPCP
jgi:SAM-dependent methyltransferase